MSQRSKRCVRKSSIIVHERCRKARHTLSELDTRPPAARQCRARAADAAVAAPVLRPNACSVGRRRGRNTAAALVAAGHARVGRVVFPCARQDFVRIVRQVDQQAVVALAVELATVGCGRGAGCCNGGRSTNCNRAARGAAVSRQCADGTTAAGAIRPRRNKGLGRRDGGISTAECLYPTEESMCRASDRLIALVTEWARVLSCLPSL